MTIDFLVDQVYLAVTGGVPSDDINVERSDIKNLAAGAISKAAINRSYQELNLATQEKREYGIGREDIGQEFVYNYTLPISKDELRGYDYADLPSKELYLPGNAGMRNAFIPGGENNVAFRRVSSSVDVINMPVISGAVWMWVESVNSYSRVYFKGLGFPKPDNIVVRAALSLNTFGSDVNLPIPDDVAYDAIQLLTDYFLRQRQSPEDTQNTAIDEKV